MPAWTSGVSKVLERQAGVMPPMTSQYMAYSNSREILSITGAFFAIATIIVLLRCYVRLSMLKVFGPDDGVMVFAMLLAAACFGCFVAETYHGLGKHLMVLMSDPMMYMNFAKILYIHAIFTMVGVSTVKISIAFFLLRLSPRTSYSRFLYGIIAFIILLTFACAMTLIFQCLPVAAAWDYTLRPPPFGTGQAQCYSTTIFRNLGLMNSAFNIVTDVLFATLPVPFIWMLQLNMRAKVSLILILSLGYFACAAGIIKAVQQWHVLEDPDWSVHDSFNVWNYLELTIGIIAASLPALKPLFNWFYETARAVTHGSRSKDYSYNPSGYKVAGGLGYRKTSDTSSNSIALQSVTSKGDSSPAIYKNPYNVHVTTNPQDDKAPWDVERRKSDDSISPLQRPNRIMMTREVHVS